MRKKDFVLSILFLLLFAVWTLLICIVDVQAIGPRESRVGFATINGLFHNLSGVHMTLYVITDWLGLVPVCFIFGFGVLGLAQWIRRKSIAKVDRNILVLGGFYIVVLAAYLVFDEFVVNYRPVLINDYLEASYPSSTTMLVLCVMPTAMMQLNSRIRNCKVVNTVIALFCAFMVLGRLISGVHWLTDIIGGALLSIGFVLMYKAFAD